SFSSGTFTVKGSGTGFGTTSDQFHYVYQTMSGDGEIRARILTVQNAGARLGREGWSGEGPGPTPRTRVWRWAPTGAGCSSGVFRQERPARRTRRTCRFRNGFGWCEAGTRSPPIAPTTGRAGRFWVRPRRFRWVKTFWSDWP